MRMQKMVISLALAAAALAAFSPVIAAPDGGSVSGVQDFELQQQLQQIEGLARARGVVLQNLQVHRSMQLGSDSAGQVVAQDAGKSCTATTHGASVSATAPTCREAAAMIANYVKSATMQ